MAAGEQAFQAFHPGVRPERVRRSISLAIQQRRVTTWIEDSTEWIVQMPLTAASQRAIVELQ